jgi:hypothetical protein
MLVVDGLKRFEVQTGDVYLHLSAIATGSER